MIEAPVVSEKASNAETLGKYTFKVKPEADKNTIKQAIETVFGVDVLSVSTISMKGKTKRTRFGQGKRKNWKKAIVTVSEGQRIDYTEVE